MLELSGIHTYYGNIHALKGVSLRVEKGEIVCLIGANGAGKTTTLMSISGVTPPRQGSVTFEGRDITRFSTERIVSRGITQVPEGRMIFPRLTVRENLLMGAYLRKDKEGVKAGEERAYELFPVLRERRSQLGHPFRGEQQMLAIGPRHGTTRLAASREPSWALRPWSWRTFYEIIKQSTPRAPRSSWWAERPEGLHIPAGDTSWKRRGDREGPSPSSGDPKVRSAISDWTSGETPANAFHSGRET
jgi:branched-chain amino acid transport system ATP-binding protein